MTEMNRRGFLASSAGLVIGMTLPGRARAQSGAAAAFAGGATDEASFAPNAFVRDDNPMVMTQGFYAELAEFCQCVLQDCAPTRGTLSFARRVMQVYEAALRSAGRRIEIED